MERTVINMLREAAQQHHNTAYVNQKGDQGWEFKTFPQVLELSGFFAMALVEAGFKANDRIALLAEGRNDWVITEFGILRAACINVPLSIKLLPEEINFRLKHAACRAIIVSANTIEKALLSFDATILNNFKLIFMDADIRPYISLLHNAGLSLESNVLMLSEMYATGKNAATQLPNKLNEIENQITENQVVTISYTSGTTGNPKGIMLTHLNYHANSNDAMQYFQVKEGDHLMLILPLDHSFAHTVGIYASLVKGLSIFFVDARGGGLNALKNIPINLKEANPHFLLTVPMLTGNFMQKMKDGVAAKGGIIEKLFNAGVSIGIEMYGNGFGQKPKVSYCKKIIYKLAYVLIFKKLQKIFGNNIRFCVGGGALLDISQQQFFAAIGVPVFQGYGLTEATPIISANTPARHKLGTSGMVIPGVECKIIDDKGSELPKGMKGEIIIRGNNVMKGYYLNPEATAATIRDGWLWTGDLGYFDEDDFLVVVGRQKALLIAANGEKYSPEGIEEAIVNASEMISQVMVYNDMSPYTIGVVTLNTEKIKKFIRENNITSSDEVMKAIRQSFYQFLENEAYKNQFPEVWIPKTFTIVAEPFSEQNNMINSTMKMVRHKVFEAYQTSISLLFTAEGSDPVHANNKHIIKQLFSLEA